MARGINKVIIVGTLGADPETRYTTSGSAITSIRLATNESWKDKNTGQMQERTEWHRVKMFGRLAEIAAEYLRKGRQVYIEGSLRTDKYTDKDGIERYTTDIIGNEMQMLGGQGESGGGRESGERGGEAGGGYSRGAQGGSAQSRGPQHAAARQPAPPVDNYQDDDIRSRQHLVESVDNSPRSALAGFARAGELEPEQAGSRCLEDAKAAQVFVVYWLNPTPCLGALSPCN